MNGILNSHMQAAEEYQKALDAYVSTTTTIDVIQKVTEAVHSGDITTLSNWTPVLESKMAALRDVSLLLKEYYTLAYTKQFETPKPVSEAFEKKKKVKVAESFIR